MVKNTSISKYMLNKKHNSINYNAVHKAAAAGILHVGMEDTATDLANPLTKLIPYSQNNELLGHILYDY